MFLCVYIYIVSPTKIPTAPPTVSAVEVFCDDMNDQNTWTISDSKHVDDANSNSRCSEPDDECIRVRGYRNEDCYIKRSVTNTYTTYTLTYDLILYGMEAGNYCRIKYSFDDITYSELASYQGDSGTLTQQFPEQKVSFDSDTGSQIYIMLETDGNSLSGGDSCYYDNVCLYGQGLATTAIPTPNPTDVTFSPTEVTPSPTANTQSPTQVTSSPSLNPSIAPTTDPTFVPTKDPTINPTNNPTVNPSFSLNPTSDPTTNPSVDPTVYPTINPISDPTSTPTSKASTSTTRLRVEVGSTARPSSRNEGEIDLNDKGIESTTNSPKTDNLESQNNEASISNNSAVYIVTTVVTLIICCAIGIGVILRKRQLKRKEEFLQTAFRASTAIRMSKIEGFGDTNTTNASNNNGSRINGGISLSRLSPFAKPIEPEATGMNFIGLPSSPTSISMQNSSNPASVPSRISQVDPAFEANLNSLMVGNGIMMGDVVEEMDQMDQMKMTPGGALEPDMGQGNDEDDMVLNGIWTAGGYDDENDNEYNQNGQELDNGEIDTDDTGENYDDENVVPTMGQYDDDDGVLIVGDDDNDQIEMTPGPPPRHMNGNVNDDSEGETDVDDDDDDVVLELGGVTMGQ